MQFPIKKIIKFNQLTAAPLNKAPSKEGSQEIRPKSEAQEQDPNKVTKGKGTNYVPESPPHPHPPAPPHSQEAYQERKGKGNQLDLNETNSCCCCLVLLNYPFKLCRAFMQYFLPVLELCWVFDILNNHQLGEGFPQFQNQVIFSRGRVLSIWEINQNKKTGSSSDFKKLKELLGFMKECLAKTGSFWAILFFQKYLRSMCDLKGSELDKVIV